MIPDLVSFDTERANINERPNEISGLEYVFYHKTLPSHSDS